MSLRHILWLIPVLAFSQNTITKKYFNFGHQLGYLYTGIESAVFSETPEWSFSTGAAGYYTSTMPRVNNPEWRTFGRIQIPLILRYTPCPTVRIKAQTDFIVHFPARDNESVWHRMGGNSPRFETAFRLVTQKRFRPALAFAVGVKFSSAKPYTIWAHRHNYDSSNGLAGMGTGEADYWLVLSATKNLSVRWTLHGKAGLLPAGSPVEYRRGSGQADQIPYGLLADFRLFPNAGAFAGISGLYNGLRHTRLAHYAVARLGLDLHANSRLSVRTSLDKGLTEASDEWKLQCSVTCRFSGRQNHKDPLP